MIKGKINRGSKGREREEGKGVEGMDRRTEGEWVKEGWVKDGEAVREKDVKGGRQREEERRNKKGNEEEKEEN